MDKFIVNGGKKLHGEIELQGSKNAALPILAASLLVDNGRCFIGNVPELADIETMIRVLEFLGAKTEWDRGKKTIAIDSSGLANFEAPYDLVRKMRASFLVTGPLLARFGRAKVSLPGGCVLGPRPVDYHLKAFSRLGATISEDQGYVIAEARSGLKGSVIHFDKPSHTGTENAMMAACLAKGETTIINAACDPEVIDLANFLNRAGGKIKGAGNVIMHIEGVGRLSSVEYEVMPDRLEAGTFMMAVGAAGGEIVLKNHCAQYMSMVLDKLRDAGMTIFEQKEKLAVRSAGRPRAFDITTFPYPGFPTDLQASAMAMACVADGISHIKETVFTERFSHVMELTRLGAQIKVAGEEAVITGVEKLRGASIMASDIRAGAGLVIAALAAEGQSEILRVYHIDRGYQNLDEKLLSLGADIKRVEV